LDIAPNQLPLYQCSDLTGKKYLARAIALKSVRKTKGRERIGQVIWQLLVCQPDVVKEFFKTKNYLFIVMDLNLDD
jgi:hypothetical protein